MEGLEVPTRFFNCLRSTSMAVQLDITYGYIIPVFIVGTISASSKCLAELERLSVDCEFCGNSVALPSGTSKGYGSFASFTELKR